MNTELHPCRCISRRSGDPLRRSDGSTERLLLESCKVFNPGRPSRAESSTTERMLPERSRVSTFRNLPNDSLKSHSRLQFVSDVGCDRKQALNSYFILTLPQQIDKQSLTKEKRNYEHSFHSRERQTPRGRGRGRGRKHISRAVVAHFATPHICAAW